MNQQLPQRGRNRAALTRPLLKDNGARAFAYVRSCVTGIVTPSRPGSNYHYKRERERERGGGDIKRRFDFALVAVSCHRFASATRLIRLALNLPSLFTASTHDCRCNGRICT